MLSSGVACSDDGDNAEPAEASTSTSTTSAPAGSEGCGGPSPEVDGQRLVRTTIESSGGTRSYMVYVPETYDPDVPAPLAYVFHGAGSNKEEQLLYSRYPTHADADGALLVLPDTCWARRCDGARLAPPSRGVDGVNDLVFFDDLATQVASSYCVDPERVLVTGMSSGGFMAASVGCTRSDEIAAVGPVTATVWAEPICGDAEPVPYAYFHGTDDPVVLYEGGGEGHPAGRRDEPGVGRPERLRARTTGRAHQRGGGAPDLGRL